MSIDVTQPTDSTLVSGAGSTVGSAPVAAADESSTTEELLVEEISIDGMCGVY